MSRGRLQIERLSRAVYYAWVVACLAALALLIGIRWFRYSGWLVGPTTDRLLPDLMILDAEAFLWLWVAERVEASTMALAFALLVVGLHRRLVGLLIHQVDGVWHLTSAGMSLGLGGMVLFHYVFDMNPTLASLCAESLVLITVTSHPRVSVALPRPLQLGFWGVALVYWLVALGDPVDRLTFTTWAAFLFATHHYLGGRVGGGALALLRVGAVLPTSLLSVMMPLLLPLHGGTRLGDGLAYTFCEVPDRGRLFANIPECDSIWTDYEHCGGGAVAEYDLSTMTRVATHRFFSPDYYGRMEKLVCLPDQVLLTVHATVFDRHPPVESVLAFRPESPGTFNPRFATGIGCTIAYDAAHDAVFLTGEFNHLIVRYDRRTGRSDEINAPELRRDWVTPILLSSNSGSASLDTKSVHPGRNRIYVTEYLHGRYAYAIDLTTLRVVDRYDVGGGSAMGVAVDAERDRLFVSSLWGLEIFDLKSDRLIARKRMGLGNRPVLIDAPRNRLYLSSMVEGKIRILDRDTLDVIGQIPIGIGSRFPQLSRDGKYLFASSAAAHYYWDADTLVRQR
jgi:hypothetical protein